MNYERAQPPPHAPFQPVRPKAWLCPLLLCSHLLAAGEDSGKDAFHSVPPCGNLKSVSIRVHLWWSALISFVCVYPTPSCFRGLSASLRLCVETRNALNLPILNPKLVSRPFAPIRGHSRLFAVKKMSQARLGDANHNLLWVHSAMNPNIGVFSWRLCAFALKPTPL